ncbi:T9SS type A sorting domain-containing protein [Prevotella sp. PINT]|jgi:hypothetical protein|uniref:T9SS type A sorting domain-containing protein n=1 Tax=Palleniella intestinalis TaxID=2736291 RepID=UPI0015567C1D|nr:T9SS type A sorting domain-containing protein [Palleniella intestinalis]NPD82006.1 T9SS type A sorting domain-containing protein [Palleniella intestinalis]
MKTFFSILFLAIMPYASFSQSLSFSYDNAGNRVKREITMAAKALPKKSNATYFSEMLSEKNIRIYPNPTKGLLKVEIIGYDSSDKCNLSIFGTSGQFILSTSLTSSIGNLDISSCPDGICLLHISLNGKESTWKIIKK